MGSEATDGQGTEKEQEHRQQEDIVQGSAEAGGRSLLTDAKELGLESLVHRASYPSF